MAKNERVFLVKAHLMVGEETWECGGEWYEHPVDLPASATVIASSPEEARERALEEFRCPRQFVKIIEIKEIEKIKAVYMSPFGEVIMDFAGKNPGFFTDGDYIIFKFLRFAKPEDCEIEFKEE